MLFITLWCFITWKNRTADFSERINFNKTIEIFGDCIVLRIVFRKKLTTMLCEFLVNDFWSVVVQYHEWKIDSHSWISRILIASKVYASFWIFWVSIYLELFWRVCENEMWLKWFSVNFHCCAFFSPKIFKKCQQFFYKCLNKILNLTILSRS